MGEGSNEALKGPLSRDPMVRGSLHCLLCNSDLWATWIWVHVTLCYKNSYCRDGIEKHVIQLDLEKTNKQTNKLKKLFLHLDYPRLGLNFCQSVLRACTSPGRSVHRHDGWNLGLAQSREKALLLNRSHHRNCYREVISGTTGAEG